MMRRFAAFVAACVFLLIVAVGAVAFPATASHAAQITPTATVAFPGIEEACFRVQGSYTCYNLVSQTPANATPSATPSATPTSTATVTPSPSATTTETPVTPSNTPTGTNTPTATPRATQTPTDAPTATSTAEPSPTQETTPPPTRTPGPSCRVDWLGVGLNIRSEPTIPSTILGVLAGPTSLFIAEIRVVDPGVEEWGSFEYQGRTGWIALYYGGVTFAVADNTPECAAVRVDADEVVRSALGWHAVISGIDNTDMAASFWTWKLRGIVPVVKAVETWQSAKLALDNGGIGVVRFKRGPGYLQDCANVSLNPEAAAADMIAHNLPYLLTYAPPSGGYWAELSNECDGEYWPQGNAWVNRYFVAEITGLNAYYPGRVVFASFLHNGWTRERVYALRDTWDVALETGACLGLHSYTLPANVFTPEHYYTMTDALHMAWYWPYIWQHRDVRRWLMELDPRYSAIPLCITEFGIGGGWQPWQMSEWVAFVSRVYQYDNVLFIAGYTSGAGGPFPVDGMMNETAQAWP